ncbi:MAG TPA: tyrosine--tRNA ligase [Candidatus Moranbacteria bacterium]|nr:tyrosine--tRNA ligase [Candidatus Moranbacteria bacterium]HRZ33769.1 tyrosine--tRNA ligase [Candidatus Moranbacteria bacterium]
MDKNIEKQIDEILTRGVENIYPSKEALKEVLMSGKKIKLYCGYDPTAKSLHIGNAISINKLGQFQKLGHEVIFLVGDFTGMIGDPTDKSAVRKKLTREEALKNSENYKKQASGYLKFDGENPVKILYNSEWNDKLTFKDLIEISSNFTAQQMFQRDMFQERIKNEKPIYLHEFLYPLAQAYDSIELNVDLEIGGNDQMFNMMCGRDLMKAVKNKEKFVLTMKLLADETGKKMGKTEGNVVNLDETAENMFGQVMAWSDGLIIPGFELCTNIPAEELKEIDTKKNPRDAKLKLAYEITKINYGEKKAKAAQDYFINTFSKKEIPSDIAEFKINEESKKLAEILVESGNAKSLSDARRKIEQGGVSIDDEKITDIQTIITQKENKKVLKIGKLGFIKIIF